MRSIGSVIRRPVAILVALLLGGCQKMLPTAPSELVEGIVIYQHADFLGPSALVTKDISNLTDFEGPCVDDDVGGSGPGSTGFSWNDCISSIRVAPGWRATIYRGRDYDDDQLTVTADIPNLTVVNHDCSKGGLNDCVSSIRVRRN